MTSFGSDDYYRKHRKLKIILLVLLIPLSVGCIIGLSAPDDSVFFGIGILCMFPLFIDIGIIIALLTKKYYNWIIMFLILVVIAIIFRHQRWPGTGVAFTFGFGGLGIVSLFSSFGFLKRYKSNPFLRFMGFFSSIVMFIVSVGLLWKNMHWALAGYMISFGMATFIPYLFAFVFILPNANFVNWTKSERIVFFRAIIYPMIFVYGLLVLMFVFPNIWTMLTQTTLYPFGMQPVELLPKTGLF